MTDASLQCGMSIADTTCKREIPVNPATCEQTQVVNLARFIAEMSLLSVHCSLRWVGWEWLCMISSFLLPIFQFRNF